MYIAEYSNAGYVGHEPRRPRKLLLQRTELKKLEKKHKDSGVTVVPVLLFVSRSGYAKLTISVAKGKKLHDKRDALKAKDQARDLDRID
jgi:SsrA-binding protein